jgi:hypothetical protein
MNPDPHPLAEGPSVVVTAIVAGGKGDFTEAEALTASFARAQGYLVYSHTSETSIVLLKQNAMAAALEMYPHAQVIVFADADVLILQPLPVPADLECAFALEPSVGTPAYRAYNALFADRQYVPEISRRPELLYLNSGLVGAKPATWKVLLPRWRAIHQAFIERTANNKAVTDMMKRDLLDQAPLASALTEGRLRAQATYDVTYPRQPVIAVRPSAMAIHFSGLTRAAGKTLGMRTYAEANPITTPQLR